MALGALILGVGAVRYAAGHAWPAMTCRESKRGLQPLYVTTDQHTGTHAYCRCYMPKGA